MKRFINPPMTDWAELSKRPSTDNRAVLNTVTEIVNNIRISGEKALREYCEKFDGYSPRDFLATQAEFENSEHVLAPELKAGIATAAKNIEAFHATQRLNRIEIETSPGVRCWREARAIERVGLYIPGGTAPLFSTLLMLAIPARLAGCKQVILCTPPRRDGTIDPAILFVAKTAKQIVGQLDIAIDMPAGPSEVLVIADETANARFVAADLLSQAEHGRDSQVMLLATDVGFINAVDAEIELQLQDLPRADVAREALGNSRAIVFDTVRDALAFSNAYAPEHLILAVANAREVAKDVAAAGSVFLGNFSPESAGDYASGTNHTLPTSGFARAYSGVSLDSFQNKITFQELSRDGLRGLAPAITTMARGEGLEAHARAVTIREEGK